MAYKKIFGELLILIGIIAAVWFLLAFFPGDKASKEAKISIKNQEKLGKFFADDISKGKEVSGKYLQDSMEKIKSRLVAKLEDSEYDYKIIVIRDSNVNAFALPGGYILVHTALLQMANSAEEVAAVLAHEIGHIEKQHILSRLLVKLGITVVDIILTGGESRVISEAAAIMANNTFSRSQEKEADNFALELMQKAEIDPRVMATFFRKLQNLEGGILSDKYSVLSTHPELDERIKNALGYKLKKGFKEKPLDIKWGRLKKSI